MSIAARLSDHTIASAVQALAEGAHPHKVLLFGSYARGDATAESDLDLLVIEDEGTDRASEIVRLRRLLRPLRVPAEVLVYSTDELHSNIFLLRVCRIARPDPVPLH